MRRRRERERETERETERERKTETENVLGSSIVNSMTNCISQGLRWVI